MKWVKIGFYSPLGIYTLSWATNIGFVNKTNKVSLLQTLEKPVIPVMVSEETTDAVNIIDGMALIQKVNMANITFSQLSQKI